MPLAPPTPDQLARLRGDFTPAYFLNLVRTKGYPATWERAVACPNRLGDKTKHVIGCELCAGRTFIYRTGTPIKVHLSSLTLKEMWREIGRFDLGTAMCTTEPGNRLAYWDRLTLNDSRMRYTEPMQRGAEDAPDVARYPVLEMEYVIDAQGTVYTEIIDFTVDQRNINWIPGQGPAEGEFYSIAYFYRPVYIVLDLIHAFRDTPVLAAPSNGDMVEMPVQAIARLDYLVDVQVAENDQS